MQTDARRKASRDYHARRAEAGDRKITLFLSADAIAKLDKLAETYGSREKALEAALIPPARAVAAKSLEPPPSKPEGRDLPVGFRRAPIGSLHRTKR